jgi:hypothetical protein
LGVEWTDGFWALVSCICLCFPGCIDLTVVHRLPWFHCLSLTSQYTSLCGSSPLCTGECGYF